MATDPPERKRFAVMEKCAAWWRRRGPSKRGATAEQSALRYRNFAREAAVVLPCSEPELNRLKDLLADLERWCLLRRLQYG